THGQNSWCHPADPRTSEIPPPAARACPPRRRFHDPETPPQAARGSVFPSRDRLPSPGPRRPCTRSPRPAHRTRADARLPRARSPPLLEPTQIRARVSRPRGSLPRPVGARFDRQHVSWRAPLAGFRNGPDLMLVDEEIGLPIARKAQHAVIEILNPSAHRLAIAQ